MARNTRSDENWVTNMYQKVEAACQDIDDFVYKEPVLFVGNQVQTVFRSVKKFYSDVMQDLILSPKCIDLAEASTSSVAAIKETTVKRNISKPKEAPVVPEMRHQPSISALRRPKRISSEVSVPHKDDSLLSKAADQAIPDLLKSSMSNQGNLVMEQSPCKDEKCDDDYELFLREYLENNEKSSELVDNESSQSDESYLDALLNSSISSQEDKCEVDLNNYDDDYENFSRELNENHKSSLELLSALRQSKRISSEVSVQHKDDSQLSKAADQAIQVLLNSSTSDPENAVMEQSLHKDEKCDDDHELFLHEGLENNEKSSELVDNESSQSEESYLDALLNPSTSSQEDCVVEQSSCKEEKYEDDHNKYDDDHEKFVRELYENHKSSLELLSAETFESDDLVSEDGDWGMKENKFDIESEAKFLRELLERKKICNMSSQSDDDSRMVNGGSGIEGKKIEVLFHEKLENDTTSSKLLNNESLQSEDSVSEDGQWGIEDISDLNVGTDEQIEVESPQNKLSELESVITCNENKEDSSSSSFKSVAVEPDKIDCEPAEGHISTSSRGLSYCESVTALGCDSSNDPTRLASSSHTVSDDSDKTDASVSITGLETSEYSHDWNVAEFEASCWSEIGIAGKPTVDSEELIMDNIDLSDNKQLAESCVIVDAKLLSFPHKSKGSRSYKKIIQDAFMSKRRLTKEYEQLSVLYGDIDNEFKQPIGNSIAPKLPSEDLPDSEWEIL